MWAANVATLDEAMVYFLDLCDRGVLPVAGQTSVVARLALSGLVVPCWWNASIPEWRAERAELLELHAPDQETGASLASYGVPITVQPAYPWHLLRSGRGRHGDWPRRAVK